ncbi:DUF2785 domain-containing protein [Hyalangium sp.]|uniref:DUF2785 domain-containing protein n=1 Tax=Hyalangium sp. TaxID=2028555 RepID=UPI002D31122B|nr:DUF2785 domain-containing protein [Hyalangium sp.]HYH96114.1 DUF2785 domain-containing protein [Hyalangium sp.]
MPPLRSSASQPWSLALLLSLALASPGVAQPAGGSQVQSVRPGCAQKDKAFWRALKARKGVPETGVSVDGLGLALASCLGSPDPELRDGLAFELLTLWMRSGALSDTALRPLTATLVGQLDDGLGESGRDTVFRRTFSALVLSEAIRRDTLQPFLTPEELTQVLTAAVRYLPREKDLRGFSDTRGWMHGVAHGSDLLWRLAMSPRVQQEGLEQILQAVAAKIAPPEHAYVHNESDRLARVVVAVIRRGLVPPEVFSRWLEAVATPQGLASWEEAFRSQAGLARLHNTKQFLRALHSALVLQKTAAPHAEQVLPQVLSALERVSLV